VFVDGFIERFNGKYMAKRVRSYYPYELLPDYLWMKDEGQKSGGW